MDALAVSYAVELNRWGIETSIIVPGSFTFGTNHFAHPGSPADKARQAEYDNGPYAHLCNDIMKGFRRYRALLNHSHTGREIPAISPKY
jgi:hypothetical protein